MFRVFGEEKLLQGRHRAAAPEDMLAALLSMGQGRALAIDVNGLWEGFP